MHSSLKDLDDSQLEALKQLKGNISDVLPTHYSDVWLIKWLRANSFNLRKTENLFRGHMRTRTIYNVDSMPHSYVHPEAALKYEFSSSIGIAKNGSPIRYTRFGTGDLPGFLLSMSAYEITLYCTYISELDLSILKKENEKTGREVSEVTYVLDLEGFTFANVMHKSVIETGLDLVAMIQDHYPEIWGNIFIVNAPMYFDKAFNIFKPIMRLNLLQKIRMASRENTAQLLLKFIDEDVLPAFLGGRRVDSFGSPRCSEFIKFGGRIPEEYYLRNRTPLLSSDPGVKSLWVLSRSVYNHSVVIRKAPSKIHVEMRSKNGSVGLKMLFRDLKEDSEDIDFPACDEFLDDNDPKCNVKFASPALRIQSHTTPVDYVCDAPWPGIYIFRFDNTYSWFTSRKLIFRIREIQS